MGNFAENLNLGNRFRPPAPPWGQPPKPSIIFLFLARVITCIGIFHTYHCHFDCILGLKKNCIPQFIIFSPLQSVNHYTFGYDFRQFRLIHGLTVSVSKRSQNIPSDCIRMSLYRGPTAGPWTPHRFTLYSLRCNFSKLFTPL